MLAPFGVDLTLEVTAAAKTPSLGVKINAEANVANEIRLATVFDGGAAQTAGLAAGDALLREVSKRMRCTIRHRDILGRISGDEFVIVLNHIGRHSDISALVKRICTHQGWNITVHNLSPTGSCFRVRFTQRS